MTGPAARDQYDRRVDLVVAGRVLTMAKDGESVQVVAIADERVTGTGTRSSAERFSRPGTRILDAGDRTVVPGFVDVHAHGEVAARTIAATVDCRAPGCKSVADVLEVFADNLFRADRGWLVGQGNLFFDQKLAETRLPTREELDGVSTRVALALRAGGHVTVLNTRAQELAGIDRDYRPPEHSVTGKPIVERDEGTREPTGVVKEMDNLLPIPPLEGPALRAAIREGMHDLFTRRGVTSVGEISETVDGLHCMDGLIESGELHVRTFVYLWAPGTMSLDGACAWRTLHSFRSPDSSFRIQGVKLFADGGYSAASAAVKREYVGHPGWCGALALSATDVSEALERTRGAGLQLAIHANGDRAQEEVCAAIAAAGGSPEGALRTRIEHAGNFLPFSAETTEWWRRAGIIPVPQPVFLYTFGDFFPVYLGDYGAQGRFPFRSLLRDGWRLSGSSDVWVGSEEQATNPFFSIWCCVSRRTFRGDTIDAGEAIPVEDALRMHTIDAAAVLGQDHLIGSLELGKLADCIVLDRDPLSCSADDLLDIHVDAVVFGGRLVYEREGARPVNLTSA
jgi:predicted amidohydrolase YtcJ